MSRKKKAEQPATALDAIASTVEAAAILGVTVDYIGALCRRGKIRSRRVGREWIVLLEDVRAMIDRPPGPGRPRSQGKVN